MSRRYNESCLYIPDEIYYGEDLFWDSNGIGYAQIFPYQYYFVTSEGDVISLHKYRPRLVKQWPNNHGHLYVDLSQDGVRERYLVHRLVAEAFLCNPHNYPIVRHLDDDPKNNHYTNLAWGTAFDNRQDMIRNGNDFKRGVYCYETGKIYRTCRCAARDLGVHYSSVTMCCQGKTYTCHGYHLCYLEDVDNKLDDPEWLKERNGFKPVTAISPSGEVMTFTSRKATAEFIGIPECGISSTISGHTSHSHGWRFKDGVASGETN